MFSSLCYGIQWDATMQFFDNNYINGNCGADSYVVNSEEKGWYSGKNGNPDFITGINIDEKASNRIKNIYDMAGNVMEWTMEGNYFRIIRGGEQDTHAPASYRMSRKPWEKEYNDPIGFRVVLNLNS